MASDLSVLIVSGIYPPDVGGPATHAAVVRRELMRRGHHVHVLAYTEERRPVMGDGTTRFPRHWHWARRQGRAAGWIVRHRSTFDVVYTTGLQPVAILAAKAAGLPVVAKMVGDPAWERSTRLGLASVSYTEFLGGHRAGTRVRAMRHLRDLALRAADRIVVPSSYLRDVVATLVGPGRSVTIPNAVATAPAAPAHEARDGELRAIFVGRLLALKRVDVLVRSVELTPGITLEVVGDGPEFQALAALVTERSLEGRVVMHGRLSHEDAVARIASSDVLCLASDVEGFPHVVIEALAAGVPVVSSRVGGVREVITHGENGLYVEPVTAEAFAATLRDLRDDLGLRERLGAGAIRTGRDFAVEPCVDRLEQLLASVT